MNELPLTYLDLRAPLIYENAPEIIPFNGLFPSNETMQELLFCFELKQEQAGRIDPEADLFLGKLVFAGRGGQGDIQLSAGLYLFAQQRRVLNREECISMAIEQQKDGLWEQLKLGNRLYIRYLYEDGSPVTQLFRPYCA